MPGRLAGSAAAATLLKRRARPARYHRSLDPIEEGGGMAANRIDVHHHPAPPSYLKARFSTDNRYPAQETWSAARSIEDMDRGGVATAMLSLPHSVHIWPDDRTEGRRLAREWNDFMAALALARRGGSASLLPYRYSISKAA